MYNYICETPVVLKHIIEHRKEITEEFVEKFKDREIEQIYVLELWAITTRKPCFLWK